MSQRSDILQSIQQNFPDNTTNFITPTRLRGEQTDFLNDTVLNEQTASFASSGSNTWLESQYYNVSGSGNYFEINPSNNLSYYNQWSEYLDNYSQIVLLSSSVIELRGGGQGLEAHITVQEDGFVQFNSGSELKIRDDVKILTGFNLYNSGSNGQVLGLSGSNIAWINQSTGSGTINTGSFATTGSNTFNGTNTFTGSVNIQSASITFLTVDTIVSSSTIFSSGSNTLGDASNDTQTLWGTVNLPTGPLNVSGTITATGPIKGTGSINLQPNESDARYLEIYNTSPTDTHITASGGQIFLGDDLTYVKVDNYGSVERIDIVAGNELNVSSSLIKITGSVQITGSLDVNDNSVVLSNQTGSFVTSAITASLITTASVSLNTITFTEGDGSTFNLTVDTGSGGGMNLGANTFTGSQTIQSASLLLQASSSIALNTSFFTASTAGAIDGANVYMFVGSANSGSVAITGSRNIGTVNQLINTQVSTRFGGFSGSGNFGTFANTYSTASRAPVLTNNLTFAAINHLMNNTSSVTTANTNIIQGAVTITGSATSAIQLTQNNLDTVTIENNFTASVGANQAVTVQGNILKGNSLGQVFVKFASTGSNSNARQFVNNILYGAAITASMEVSGNSNLANLYNTAVIGAGLVVSGTMPSQAAALSGSMFVGKWNSTASIYPMVSSSLADAGQVVFAVGAGIASGSRKTPLYVSASGLTVIGDNAFISGTLTIEQNTDTNAIALTQQGVSSTPTWAISQTAGGDTTTTILTNATHYFTGLAATRYHFSVPTVVSSSLTVTGSTTITADGVNAYVSSFAPRTVRINDGCVSGVTSSIGLTNTTIGTNACSIAAGQNGIIVGSDTSTVSTGGVVVGIYSSTGTTINQGNYASVALGTINSNISASNNSALVATSASFIANSRNSIILGGENIRLQNTTGSVALDRDAAYTGSANYTLYTQNINASGSVSITGSILVTGDVKFASGSNTTMGTAVLDGANPGSATVSNTLVTANSLIFLTKQTNNHPNAGPVVVSSKGSSTFTITSNHNGDTDTVAYLIVNPA